MCTHVSATLKIERNQIHSETLFPLKKTIFELKNEDKLRFDKYAIYILLRINRVKYKLYLISKGSVHLLSRLH